MAAVLGEADAVAAAAEGSRNDRLNRAAFALGTFVGAGALGADEARGVLLEAASRCGLPTAEAAATIRSGLAAGIRHPRPPRSWP